MCRREMARRANLIMLPAVPGQGPLSPAQEHPTVDHAIRHVMEVLPREQRQSAVIQTPTRLLFLDEIEALFEKAQERGETRALCS
jgi:hypothetical protein